MHLVGFIISSKMTVARDHNVVIVQPNFVA